MSANYEVSIYLSVYDEAALLNAARAKIREDGIDPADLEDDGELTVQTALRWLLDPGNSPPGCEILDSTCE